MKKTLQWLSEVVFGVIRTPPILLLVGVVAWIIAIASYKYDLHLINNGEVFSTYRQRLFNKGEFLAYYLPLIFFLARIVDVIVKKFKTKDENKNS